MHLKRGATRNKVSSVFANGRDLTASVSIANYFQFCFQPCDSLEFL